MITTETPIGEVISFIYDNENCYKDEVLFKKIKYIVDLTILKSNSIGFQDTLKSLWDVLFEVRIELLRNTDVLNQITTNLNSTIQERIKNQFDEITKYKNLELAFVTSLSLYNQISQSNLNNLPQQSFNTMRGFPKLDYENFSNLLKSLPGQESKLTLHYLNASISFDFALIVSELVFADKLNLNKTEIEDLIIMLKNSIEDFALCSFQFGFWTPREEDESQWIRNIKIRISLLESNFTKNHTNFSTSEINTMFLA